jgi:cytochrome P450
LHDPELFPQPDVFSPRRFLGDNGDQLAEVISEVFGSGRRVCPGRHFADSALWALLAAILATLDFSPAEGFLLDEVKYDNLTFRLVDVVMPIQCLILIVFS